MTSRRAQRRARGRASVATVPGRELERWQPAEVASTSNGEALAAMIPQVPGSTEPAAERAARLDRDALRARMLAANWAAGNPAGLGYGSKTWREVTRVQVPADLRRDRVPGAGVPLECYGQALAYAVDHADRDVTLIHGLVMERGRLWPHAWVLVGEVAAWCPTTGEHYDLASWNEVLQPTILDAFTPEQAAHLAIAEGNAGPWRPSQEGQRSLLITAAASRLFDSYALTHPDLIRWVTAMRECDGRFADDLEALEHDPIAVVDLLAELMEHPDLWRSHEPGAPWPYRLRNHLACKETIFPEVA